MNNAVLNISESEERRLRRFEARVSVCASGGKFCDGWILAVIGVALPLVSLPASEGGLDIPALWLGLLGSASLIGLFIGGLFFGWVTDQVGRKKMFLFTLLTFLICSALQFFVTDEVQLFFLRLIMGLAVGADYAIAGSMIAEFTTKKRRGPYLAGMIAWWFAGYAIGASLALIVAEYFPFPDLWRYILASSFVPALIMLLMRLGLPESPRWLASKGRNDEAKVIADRYLFPEVANDVFKESKVKATYATLFSKEYIRRTALCGLFWMAQVTPLFAIFTFLPIVLESLGLDLPGAWAEIVLYMFLLVGSIIGAGVVNKIGRRRLLIWPFIFQAAAFVVLGLFPEAPSPVIIGAFIVFAFFNSASGVLQMLYPAEIFPTDIRATGVGFSAAMSRIGAAIGTFLLPIGLVSLGVGPVMLFCAGMLVIGLIVSIKWAPETNNLELSESTSSIPIVVPR